MLELDGARVGIVGTGSTAVQLVCGIVDRVDHLTLFQRTAQWIMPLANPPHTEEERVAFRRDPERLAQTHRDLSDLYDLFSNFGAAQVAGGLNLLANLIGKPGKNKIDGSKVQDMYDTGQAEELNDYCRCDVLDTYFVFLRSRVLLGKLTIEEEHEIVAETKQWLEQQAEKKPAYRNYLDHWGDWRAPE